MTDPFEALRQPIRLASRTPASPGGCVSACP